MKISEKTRKQLLIFLVIRETPKSNNKVPFKMVKMQTILKVVFPVAELDTARIFEGIGTVVKSVWKITCRYESKNVYPV